MGKQFLWAIFFFLLLAPSAFVPALAADPPNYTPPQNYIPPSARDSSAVQNAVRTATATATNVNVPTPDTIPAPPAATTTLSAGQYRNAKGEVKLAQMLLSRYKQSVVRVSAKDLAGNELARAMGVGVGRNAQYIATPLSLVLGNGQQWADTIEITHSEGNKYTAQVALIDEERNIVLLAPQANPAPMPFVRENNERPQMDVFTISFNDGAGAKISPAIHRSMLAAANQENGLLSISGNEVTDAQAGTGVLNSQGELVGMLLPGGQGVLSSYIERLIVKAQKAKPLEPNRIGVILGRGVLVGNGVEGAFPTISAALEAIKKGEAPKTDPTRFIPAKTRMVAPKDADRVVVRVLPGRYQEDKTLSLPSNLSLAGSGPAITTIAGGAAGKPVLLIQGEENTLVSGLRILPPAKQEMKAPTVIVNKGKNISFLGNVIETKGGIGLWARESTGVRLEGNAFPRGQQRAVSCERSTVRFEANAFLGDWPVALSLDKGCRAEVVGNLFLENKVSAVISTQAGRLAFERNSFIRGETGLQIAGSYSSLALDDNLFYEQPFGLNASGEVGGKQFGRNAVWRSRLAAKGRNIPALDLVRTEPRFVDPAAYDFRPAEGQAQLANALKTPGAYLGAFQPDTWMGPFTQQLARSLAVAAGTPALATSFGATGQ